MDIKRLFDILPYQKKQNPKEDILAYKVKGQWIKYSTDELIRKANSISLGLLRIGIQRDDKVAIISPNRPEWNFVDFGIQQIGAVSVPMYPTITEEDFAYIFNDSGAKVVFVANKELYEKVKRAAAKAPSIQRIFTFERVDGAEFWTDMIELAKNDDPATLEPLKAAVSPEDLLTLIYTSGTTGNPKGVMLTHHNIVANIEGSMPLVPVTYESTALSFLPLCHIYERMVHYLYMYVGVSVYYAESMETISENIKEIKPNIFVTVPRLLEKVYDKIVAKGYELTGIKKALFFWALELGLQYEVGKNMGWWYDLQLSIANKLIFNKWREALGGNIVALVSGGAALQPRLAKVFWAAQIKVIEGYGLTETSPVIAVNGIQPGMARVGTVGTVIKNVQVKIASDGEILAKGPSIMRGYYNRPDLTAEAIDSDGWFHTGDIGEMVEGKYLKITDRKKEMFKTSGGKYVAPQPIENKLKESLVIEQAMVIGENQKFPSALIVPSFQGLKDWCEHKGIPYTTDKEMLESKDVKEKFHNEIEKHNESLAQYERIKKIVVLNDVWGIDSGEMTPTLKLKRKFILNKYQKEVASIYASE
jgi:long-chain acyl-CoA synthetase